MGTIAQQMFALPALREAWRVVLANDRQDGFMSFGVANFLEDEQRNLDALAARLGEGTYRVGELTPVTLASSTKQRQLHIPCVRDRIAARALLADVTPLIDPYLGCAAYAYRSGLGVADAVQAVARLRDSGLPHVLRTDVRDCFPTLPKQAALRRFATLVRDPEANHLVEAFLHRSYRSDTGVRRELEGVPQGCPLSPILANLVLVDLDHALMRQGFPVVRYGDDLLAAAPSTADAQEAARIAHAVTEALGMRLNTDKTRITSFEEGFTFLGEDFGPRFPPALDDLRIDEPLERTLYVGLQGSRIRIRSGRVQVETANDEIALDVPSSQVARIACFGSVGLSAGTRAWALSNEIDVVFASRKGSYLGTMLSHGHRYRPARLRAQIAALEGPRALEVGASIVTAKIIKQQVLSERFNRRPQHERVVDAIGQMESLMRMVPDAATRDELMGLEGAAARA